MANTPGAIEPILCALREKVTDGAAHLDLLGTAVRVGAIVWPPTLLCLSCWDVVRLSASDGKTRKQVGMKALVPMAPALGLQSPATLGNLSASSGLTHRGRDNSLCKISPTQASPAQALSAPVCRPRPPVCG